MASPPLRAAATTAAPARTPPTAAEAVEGSTIRFAPQDFAESKTLTEVYAQYLEAQGFDVEVQPASGFRDQVYPGLENDDLDIIIDYTGSATRFLDPEATPSADSDGDLRRR